MSKKNTSADNNASVSVVIRILSVACVLAALILVGVLAFAFLGDSKTGNDGASTSVVPPEIVATTESTTQPTTAINVKIKATVYVKSATYARAIPATNGEIVYQLVEGESVGFVSKDSKGWSKVVYGNSICYIPTKNLTTKKPAVVVTTSSAALGATTIGALTESTTAVEMLNGKKVINPNQKRWYLVVVDHSRTMPEGYEPELAYIVDDYELDARVADAFNEMYDAAAEEEIYLTPVSAYRLYSTQESNLNALIEEYMEEYDLEYEDAKAQAETEILPAGCSEHNLGIAVDIGSVDESFADSYEYEWLCENAADYGFIERYTEEKQSITGIIPEPWHWRYVGPTYAKKIKASGLCLEEFLQKYNVEY